MKKIQSPKQLKIQSPKQLKNRCPFCHGTGGTSRHTCNDCHGTGGTSRHTCNDCHGTGRSPRHTCNDCHGSGKWFFFFDCMNCGGKGYIPKRKCSNCHGKGYIPERKCFNCDGKGYIPERKCFNCDGKGYILYTPTEQLLSQSKQLQRSCPVCGGTGISRTYGIPSPCPRCRSQNHGVWMRRNIPPSGWPGF